MLKRFILWDYPRGGWHYDVMVGVILAFTFLMPRDWFRDRPRIPNARSIASLPSEHGSSPYWIEKLVLGDTPESERLARATQALRAYTGNKRLAVSSVEPIHSSEGELLGYIAFVRP